VSTKPATSREVTVDVLGGAVAAGATLVDVREGAEYIAGHVPGARLIPMGQLPGRVNELDREKPVYLICSSGNRSAAMTDFLTYAGYEVYSVAGGTTAWQRAGYALATGSAA